MDVATAKQLFIKTLEENEDYYSSYEDYNEKTVKVVFARDNLDKIDCYIGFFPNDSGRITVHLYFYNLFNYSDKYADGIIACNEANDNTFATFCLDDDKDAVASYYLTYCGLPGSTYNPTQVLETAVLFASTIDEEYPRFAKAKWS